MKTSTLRQPVALMFCGGDTALDRDLLHGRAISEDQLGNWVKSSPELAMTTRILPQFFYSGERADMPLSVLADMAKFIASHVNKVKGFVITHSYDEMPFDAAMLAMMLGGTPKPIVFTGSPAVGATESELLPQHRKEAVSGRWLLMANVMRAAQAVDLGFSEVSIFFRHQLFRATRTIESRFRDLPSLDSSRFPALGNFEFDRSVREEIFWPSLPIHLRTKIDTDILVTEGRFGAAQDLLSRFDPKRHHGVFLNGNDQQPLGRDVMSRLEHLSKKGVPIGVFSQTQKPNWLRLENPFIVRGMTWDTAMAKFCWALGQSRDPKVVHRIMATNLAGEMVISESDAINPSWIKHAGGMIKEFQGFLSLLVKA